MVLIFESNFRHVFYLGPIKYFVFFCNVGLLVNIKFTFANIS